MFQCVKIAFIEGKKKNINTTDYTKLLNSCVTEKYIHSKCIITVHKEEKAVQYLNVYMLVL